LEEYQEGEVGENPTEDDLEEFNEEGELGNTNEFNESGVYGGTEGYGDIAGYSEPKQLGGLYALFSDVLNRVNSIKVSNINKGELGDLGISVRECLRIAQIANTFGHPIFARFFLEQGLITTDSAMAKEGWFTELFITSKKFAQKSSSSHIGLPQQGKKWKMFSRPQDNLANNV